MIEDLRNERIKKLMALRKLGMDPYPARAKRTHLIAEIREQFGKLEKSGAGVSVAGRVTGIRDQGGVLFFDLADESGALQGVAQQDLLAHFNALRDNLDIGDFLEATGTLFTTQKGEESIALTGFTVLAKSIRPPPSPWHGLEDTETRLRKRYLDLMAHPELRELFAKKTVFWETARVFLKERGFLEVETPVLEATPGGADAEPFLTHHNALHSDFYLRISLEIALKKLLVAGYEKIFEIGRIFRNEGMDQEHLQDYTQLECYWAYHDYNDMMRFTEELYKKIIHKVTGGLETARHGETIQWGAAWGKVQYCDIFREMTGLDPASAADADLRKRAKAAGMEDARSLSRGRLIDILFKKLVRHSLVQPVFLIDPPSDIEPLAKRIPGGRNTVERFQIVACGTELGKGFSEANDPLDQRARFEEQMKLRMAGDKEAQRMDEDFLEALEYGMPPAAGFGASERLFAVLMDKPVRETVFFPLMRPKSNRE